MVMNLNRAAKAIRSNHVVAMGRFGKRVLKVDPLPSASTNASQRTKGSTKTISTMVNSPINN